MRPRLLTEEQFAAHQARVRGGASVVNRGTIPASRDSRHTPQQGRADGTGQPIKSAKVTVSSPYKSKWEANFAAKLELEKRAGLIKAWWHEPFSLWLPGKVRYKPDFMVQRHDPRFVVSVESSMPTIVEIIEVKGFSKNRRDGMTRLKVAAAIYNCFIWRLVYRTKNGGWDGEYV